jgi:hypothetical protein
MHNIMQGLYAGREGERERWRDEEREVSTRE